MAKTDAELLAQALDLHTEAEALLIKVGLLETIQHFGPTLINGSYALNLMVHRDLDIAVQLQDDLDISNFFAIGTAITNRFQVLKASYSNHFIRHFPGFDHGLFWGIQLNHKGEPWKLDLWGYGPQKFAEHYAQFNQLQTDLKVVDPLTILRIKDDLFEGDSYRYGVHAYAIYSDILTADVKTTKQFLSWWENKPKL